ncbi:MAG: DUF2961 domain-containing protein [Bacteroidales bacterium]|nr:DUF2961 domain-containing protein [Bacteroidales bacterium]
MDGENFPSTFGTGSEDYFGYAWGNPSFFQKPYHSQNMTMENNGHQTLVRWHLIDNIPFQKSFDGYIEKYYQNECGTFYNCVVYWYLAPEGKDPYSPVTVSVDHIVVRPDIDVENNHCLEGGVIKVNISGGEGNIHYTLDGSMPDENDPIYSSELKVNKSCVLKARELDTKHQVWSRVSTVDLKISDWYDSDSDLNKLQTGLQYKYYEEDIVWSRLPDYSKMEPVKEGISAKVGLTMNPREDNFGVRFEGYLHVEEDGLYRFFLESDDGSCLYVWDNLIINNDLNHGFLEMSGIAALKKGYHPLRIDYYESGLYQGIWLRIEKDGMEKKEVGNEMLFHAKGY